MQLVRYAQQTGKRTALTAIVTGAVNVPACQYQDSRLRASEQGKYNT